MAKELIIDKLTALLIKTDFKEKKLQRKIYVRKTDAYKDLIKFIKELEKKYYLGGIK
jgi:hypothetical protein